MIWKPNVTVAAVVERDGKFLLVAEKLLLRFPHFRHPWRAEEDADGEIVLNQPAGHLDAGESLANAVARETLEETGWRFAPRALLGIYRWPKPGSDTTYLRFAFTGELLGHEADRPLDTGILRALWLTPDELRAERARHRSPLVERCVNDYLAGQRYPLDLLKDPC